MVGEFELFAFASSIFPIFIFYFKTFTTLHFEDLSKARIEFRKLYDDKNDGNKYFKKLAVEYGKIKGAVEQEKYAKEKADEIKKKLRVDELGTTITDEGYIEYVSTLAINEKRINDFRYTANALLGCWVLTLLFFISILMFYPVFLDYFMLRAAYTQFAMIFVITSLLFLNVLSSGLGQGFLDEVFLPDSYKRALLQSFIFYFVVFGLSFCGRCGMIILIVGLILLILFAFISVWNKRSSQNFS
jgi:hypothetical protein